MMKRISYILLLLVIGIMVLLLLNQEEYHLSIVTSPTIHSYYYTDQTETITIDVLSNQPEHYFFDTDYISNCAIQNDETTFPFTVVDITFSHDLYTYLEQDYTPIQIKLKPQISATNQRVAIPNATLVLVYDNAEELQLNIGEFNYLFYETLDNDLTLSNLSATYTDDAGYPSVSGVNISISNRTNDPLTINDIALISDSAVLNTTMIRYREACDKNVSVADCLWIDQYQPLSIPHLTPLVKTITAQTTLDMYIPLSFETISHIEQFAIDITYEHNGSLHHFIIDDFPYLQTSAFQPGYEEEYIVHVFDDPTS